MILADRQCRNQVTKFDGAQETVLSQCIWVTTLSANRAPTLALVELGHARWEIENQGFNETVNRWQLDHVYRHEATAMLTVTLVGMIAYNLFHAFYFRNLKPDYRRRLSYLHVARCVASDLY